MYHTGGCTEGRQLLVIIAAYINEGRYSNSPTYNSELSEALIEHVLNLPVFITRTPNIHKVEFAKTIARGKKDFRVIYIYDNGIILSGYIAADAAINRASKSRVIPRLIDTGKLYNNQYFFTSTLL